MIFGQPEKSKYSKVFLHSVCRNNILKVNLPAKSVVTIELKKNNLLNLLKLLFLTKGEKNENVI